MVLFPLVLMLLASIKSNLPLEYENPFFEDANASNLAEAAKEMNKHILSCRRKVKLTLGPLECHNLHSPSTETN